MYISVAENEKGNGSIVGSILPIYTRPGPVQVRTWTFPQVDPHRTGSKRSRVNKRPIWAQSGTGPKFIWSRVNGALNMYMAMPTNKLLKLCLLGKIPIRYILGTFAYFLYSLLLGMFYSSIEHGYGYETIFQYYGSIDPL